MVKKCPKCGDPHSLEYDLHRKKWSCLWRMCDYEEKDDRKLKLKDVI